MALTGKLFREITREDIQELVANRIAEDSVLEYKRQALNPSTPPKPLDDEKDELLTDLISLANASGGHLLIGVEADAQERAAGFVMMTASRATTLAIQFRDVCAAHIKPAIEGLEIQPFCMDSPKDEWLVIVAMSPSSRKPHMSAFRQQTKFHIRVGNRRREMTYEEILQAFTARNDQYFAQIISRLDRLSEAPDVPLTLAELDEAEWWDITNPLARIIHVS